MPPPRARGGGRCCGPSPVGPRLAMLYPMWIARCEAFSQTMSGLTREGMMSVSMGLLVHRDNGIGMKHSSHPLPPLLRPLDLVVSSHHVSHQRPHPFLPSKTSTLPLAASSPARRVGGGHRRGAPAAHRVVVTAFTSPLPPLAGDESELRGRSSRRNGGTWEEGANARPPPPQPD